MIFFTTSLILSSLTYFNLPIGSIIDIFIISLKATLFFKAFCPKWYQWRIDFIIKYCLTNDIGKLIIGKNDGWKQNINLGKRNNQNFVQIPFNKLIQQLKYKGELIGIEVETTEESYTSKCSFIDDESLNKHDNYCGRRIKRGLFRSKLGKIINADINGALNIIRKVVPNFNIKGMIDGIEGVAVHPLLVTIWW